MGTLIKLCLEGREKLKKISDSPFILKRSWELEKSLIFVVSNKMRI